MNSLERVSALRGASSSAQTSESRERRGHEAEAPAMAACMGGCSEPHAAECARALATAIELVCTETVVVGGDGVTPTSSGQ